MLADGIAGAFAGAVSCIANNPVDVVKTKLQGLEADKYKGVVDCFQQVMRNEGFGGFYSGVGPRMVKVCLDVALTFSIFNGIKRALTEYASKQD